MGRETALAHLTSFNIPLLKAVHLDFTALSFTLLLAVITGLVFGLVPALQVPKAAVSNSLKEQTRGSTDSHWHTWIRGALVISEIAFACMLMVGAGLLIRSFFRVLDVNMGFQPARAASIRIDPAVGFDTQAKANAYVDEVLRRVRNVPGVEGAGLPIVCRSEGIERGVPGQRVTSIQKLPTRKLSCVW